MIYFLFFISSSIILLAVLIFSYLACCRQYHVKFLTDFVRKRYLKARFKIWDDLVKCEKLKIKSSDNKPSPVCRFRFFWHKLQSSFFYYCALLFKSPKDSFVLLNCDRPQEECRDDDFPQHIKKQKRFSHVSMYVLFLLIIGNIVTGLVSSILFPNIFNIWASNQIIHNSLADWQTGSYDSSDYDISSDIIKLQLSASTTIDSFEDFTLGQSTSTELYYNSGFVQPKEGPNLLWTSGEMSYLDNVVDNNGGMYSIWINNNEIIGRAISAEGVMSDEFIVSNYPSSKEQNYLKVHSDDNGGAIILWSDERNESWDVYLQYLNADGGLLENDLPVVDHAGDQREFLSDINGQYLAILPNSVYEREGAWGYHATFLNRFNYSKTSIIISETSSNYNNSHVLMNDNRFFFYADNLATTTSLDLSTWEKKDRRIIPGESFDSGYSSYLSAIESSDGGVIFYWRDYRNHPAGDNYDIYIQKVDSNGELVFPEGGISLIENFVSFSSFTLLSDGNGGAFYMYNQETDQEDRYDVYISRFNSSGAIPESWGGPKLVATDSLGGLAETHNPGEVIVAFANSTGQGAQLVNLDGNFLWTENAYLGQAFLGSSYQDFCYYGGNYYGLGMYINMGVNGNGYNCFAQKINSSGLNMYSNNGYVLYDTHSLNDNSSIDHIYTSDGGLIILYPDLGIAQKINFDKRYLENSEYISRVVDLDNNNWQNLAWVGSRDGVTVYTRTSNNWSLAATASSSGIFDRHFFFGTLSTVYSYPGKTNDGFIYSTSFNHPSAWYSPVTTEGACGNETSVPASEWLELDYGEEKTISKARLYFTSYYIAGVMWPITPNSFRIETWDGSGWTSRYSTTVSTSTDYLDIEFTSVTTSKIRIFITAHNNLGFSGINEFETYTSVEDVWSDWEEISEEGDILSPKKRFLQFKIAYSIASTTAEEDLPAVGSVTLDAIPGWFTDSYSPIYTSAVLDSGYGNYGTVWDDLDFEYETPEGTSVALATRSGQTATPDSSWSDWATTTDGNIASPAGRYFQYRIALSSNDSTITPTLSSVTIDYTPHVGPGDPNEYEGDDSLSGASECYLFDEYADFETGTADSGISISTDSGLVSLKAIYYAWTENGEEASDEGEEGDYKILVHNNALMLVWQDMRYGDTALYAQRYSENGDGEAYGEWGNDGVQVMSVTGYSAGEFDLTERGDNYFLAWIDNRNGAKDVYAQKKYSGSDAIAWNQNGVPVSDQTADSEKRNPKIIERLGSDTCLVSWEDNRNGVYDIFINVLLDDGNVVFPNDFGSITSANDKSNHSFFMNDDGSIIAVWQEARSGHGDIYAKKFAADGSTYPGWEDTGTLVCGVEGEQKDPEIISDGNGGVIVVWRDERNIENDIDIYAQRINSDGMPQWGENGLPVAVQAYNQYLPKIISDGSNGVYITWEDQRNQTEDGNSDIYFQRILSNGSIAYEENGRAVSTANSFQYKPAITRSGDYVYIAWEDWRDDETGKMYVQKYDSNGTIQWPDNGTALTSDSNQATYFQLAGDDDGDVLAVYHSVNNQGDISVKAQKILATPLYSSSGYFTSETIDVGQTAAWLTLESVSSVPTNTSVTIETRTINGEPSLGENLSLGATATSSSYYNDDFPLTASGAIDGSELFNPGDEQYSAWANDFSQPPSADSPAWVEIDFGEEKTIGYAIVKFWSMVNDGVEYSVYGTNYSFQAWNGTDWVSLTATTTNTSAQIARSFTPVNTQKIRFIATGYNTEMGMPAIIITEFETYAEAPVEWSEWQEVSGTTIQSPNARYLQWRAHLSTSDLNATPSLSSVETCYSTRVSSETIEYTPVDSGSASTTWLSLYASTTIPSGTSIEWATRSGDTATPDENWDEWATTTYAISNQHGRYLQYRAYLTTSNPLVSPEISRVTVRYLTDEGEEQNDDDPPEEYDPDLSYMATYQPVDSESASTTWVSLSASTTIPAGTSITWATRSGNSETPDGTWDEWATTTGAISGQHGRYLQYRAWLGISEAGIVPEIHSVTVNFIGSNGEEEEQTEEDPEIIEDPDEDDEETQNNTVPGAVPTIYPIMPPTNGIFSCSISPDKTSDREVVIKMNGGQNTLMMAVSERSDFALANLVYYKENYDYTLSSEYGIKNIYVRFFTNQGVPSEVVSCRVELVSASSNGTSSEKGNNESGENKEELKTKEEKEIVEKNDDSLKETNSSNQEVKSEAEKQGGIEEGETELGKVEEEAVKEEYRPIIEISKNLAIGESDLEVKILKGMLVELEYLPVDFDISNDNFDETTKQAVIRFQSDNGIEAIGIIGPKTRSALNTAYAESIPKAELAKNSEENSELIDESTNIVIEPKQEKKPVNFSLAPEKIISLITEWLSMAVSSTGVAVTTTGLAVTYIAISLVQIAGQINSFSQIPYMFLNLFGLLAYRKKRRAGAVYDSETGQPVPLARITVYDKKTGQAKETKVTDKFGSYYFLVPKGEYYLQAEKKGYKFLSRDETESSKTLYSEAYAKSETIKFEKEDIISKNLPIQRIKPSKISEFFAKPFIGNILSILFIAGLISSLFLTVIRPSFINHSIAILYIALALLKYANFSLPRWGVVSLLSGLVQPFTMIEALSAKNKEFFGRTVADEHGRYAFILDKGEYLLKARSIAGKTIEEKLAVKNKRVIAGKNIKIK